MMVVITYDVNTETNEGKRRLRQVAKQCVNYGQRVQNSVFECSLDAAQLAAFNAATPNRFAFKHAHSQRTPEKDWGRFTLQAIAFAYWVLNDRYGIHLPQGRVLRSIRPANTLVRAEMITPEMLVEIEAVAIIQSGVSA